MKWFEHDVDMHTDLKVQHLIEKHGLEGYAIWCLCLEFVGKEGRNGRLDGQTRWLDGLLRSTQWSGNGESVKRLKSIIQTLSDVRLICPKSFKYGNLKIPNFIKRADNYEKRKQRKMFEQNTANVPPHNITLHNITIQHIRSEYAHLKNLSLDEFVGSDYARTGKAIKNLIGRAKGNEAEIIEGLHWASKQKWCDWTLETLDRKWLDFKASKAKQPENRRATL